MRWLCGELRAGGCETSEPDVEDWGWFVYVEDGGSRYLVGASGEPTSGGRLEWVLQIHRRRSLWDRLRGANRLTPDAPLVTAIGELLRAQPDFSRLEVEEDS